MQTQTRISGRLLLAGGVTLAAFAQRPPPPRSYERLVNADKEPQNWLMVHRTYDSPAVLAAQPDHQAERQRICGCCSRFGDRRQHGNEVGGSDHAGRRWIHVHRRPLGVVYKIDVRSGTAGRIVWKMDSRPGKRRPQSRRDVVGQSRPLGPPPSMAA